MVKLKEKIVLKTRNSSYVVSTLENRIEPAVGKVLSADDVSKLLLEAKVSGALTVKVI
jgi:hypothetical protein